MVIAYDKVFELKPDEKVGEKVELAAHSHMKVMVCMRATDFRIDYDDGKASISLARHLTHEEAKRLAHSILARVSELEEQEKQWHVVTGTQSGPTGAPSVTKLSVELAEGVSLTQGWTSVGTPLDMQGSIAKAG